MRNQIAQAILQDPEAMIEEASAVLESRAPAWEQWISYAWSTILITWHPEEIAQMIVSPIGWYQEALADHNPFQCVYA